MRSLRSMNGREESSGGWNWKPPRLLAEPRGDHRRLQRRRRHRRARPDGSILKLRKIDTTYDPSNATTHIAQAAEKGEVLTGLLYLAPDAEDLHSHLNTYETAFNKLAEKDLCPGAGMLERINAGLR